MVGREGARERGRLATQQAERPAGERACPMRERERERGRLQPRDLSSSSRRLVVAA